MRSCIAKPIMRNVTIVGGTFAILLVVVALVTSNLEPAAATWRAAIPSSGEPHEGLLYGRITTVDGALYEGRLRWGGNQEALWGNYFNGFKDENPWAAYLPSAQRPSDRTSIDVFGFEIPGWKQETELRRPLMVRFGHIARIEPRGSHLWVTLKNGTVFRLDRFSADDMNDGVRVWDRSRGVVDLGEWRIRSIELLATEPPGTGPNPLHGTVRTRHGDFTGLVQWDRQECVDSDEIDGHSADGDVRLRFDTIHSIERRGGDSALVTLRDGREIVLSGTRKVGNGHLGIYVDDTRYGRVLISWEAFERVDFSPGGTGPAYRDFAPGGPLTGSVTTRSGRRLAGRLVYDLDESETTETLDAAFEGVNYTIPLSLIASVVPDGREERARLATVILHDGEELSLERSGDLGEGHAGMLIFVEGRERPEYVPWSDVAAIDFHRPAQLDSARADR
jgi:hypothetical protein